MTDEDAAVVELKADGHVQALRKGDLLIRFAIVIVVFENEDLVVHLATRLPLRIALEGGNPKATARVKGHAHRVAQIGKLLLAGEQLNDISRRELEVFLRFLGIQKLDLIRLSGLAGHARVLACILLLAGAKEGLHIEEGRAIAVVDGRRDSTHAIDWGRGADRGFDLALHDVPDALVAVGHFHIKHLALTLKNIAIGLIAIREFQVGTAAIDIVGIDDAVAVVPVEVFVFDGCEEGFV